MTTVYLLILDEGSYSDRTVSTMGIFSTREKAEEHREKLLQPPYTDSSQLRAEYDALVENLEKQRQENTQAIEKKIKHLQQRLELWDILPAQRTKLENDLRLLERTAKTLERSAKTPACQISFEHYYKNRNRPVAQPEDLIIEEWPLDDGYNPRDYT